MVALSAADINLLVTVCVGEELFEEKEEEGKASSWKLYLTGNARRCLYEDCC